MVVPLLPAAEPSKFLIACPTAISDETKAALESAVHSAVESCNANPSKTPIFTYLPARAVAAGIDASSIGDLYRLGFRARELGWENIAVADPLTIRQLWGDTYCGEDLDPHFVVLGAQRHPKGGIGRCIRNAESTAAGVVTLRKNTIQVVQILSSDAHTLVLEPLQTDDIADRFDPNVKFPFRYKRGMIIRDPRGRVIGADTDEETSPMRSIIDAAMNKEPGLPADIKMEILQMIEEDMSIEELTEAPAMLDWVPNVLEIHVTSNLSETDLAALQQTLNTCIERIDPFASYKLHQWRGLGSATRKDFCCLWQRLLGSNIIRDELFFVFLDPELWRKQSKLGVVFCPRHSGPKQSQPHELEARKVSLETAIRAWNCIVAADGNVGRMMTPDTEYLEGFGGGELVCDPSSHFYHDFAPWISVETVPRFILL